MSGSVVYSVARRRVRIIQATQGVADRGWLRMNQDQTLLVSVILPTYQRPHLLKRAMQSVLNQSYPHLELIVVDDASADATEDVVASVDDERVRYVKQPTNRGASAARNRGIREAKGAFLAFQDDDDIWFVDRLKLQLEHLLDAGEDTALSLAGHIHVSPRHCRFVGGEQAFKQVDFSRGINSDFSLTATPCWLVKKSVLDEVGVFDEEMSTWEDWELALRISQVKQLVHVPGPLLLQDRHRGGGLSKEEKHVPAAMRIVESRHHQLWDNAPLVRSAHAYRLGRAECLIGDFAAGRDSLRVAWRLRPFSAQCLLANLAALCGRHVFTLFAHAGKSWRGLSRYKGVALAGGA